MPLWKSKTSNGSQEDPSGASVRPKPPRLQRETEHQESPWRRAIKKPNWGKIALSPKIETQSMAGQGLKTLDLGKPVQMKKGEKSFARMGVVSATLHQHGCRNTVAAGSKTLYAEALTAELQRLTLTLK